MKEENYILKVLNLRQEYECTKDKRFKLTQPYDVVQFLTKEIGSLSKEHFLMIGLNTKNEVNVVYTVHKGSLNWSIAHPRDSFQVAILHNCQSVIFAHNHPSQDVTPSPNDIRIAKKFKVIGKLLDIEVLDSFVITDEGYASLEALDYLDIDFDINEIF
ncbi:TPA: JAB domain-containing protein [Staphylococcus aureus]